MTHQHTEAKIISPKKRATVTEPHYMFCGTSVEEHWCRRRSGLTWLQTFLITTNMSTFLLSLWKFQQFAQFNSNVIKFHEVKLRPASKKVAHEQKDKKCLRNINVLN